MTRNFTRLGIAVLLSFSLVSVPDLLATKISPTQVTVKENATQQFDAHGKMSWRASCGTITAAGLFTAPLTPMTCEIVVTDKNGRNRASAIVTVESPIRITPASAETPQGKTTQFTASEPVKWTANCGAISTSGLFTANAAVGSKCTIQGTAVSGTPYTVYGSATIVPPNILSIAPMNPRLTEGDTLHFAASSAATWTASCGTISNAGLYTAPLSSSSCTITATATDHSGDTASTNVTVSARISITPATVALHALGTAQFTANIPAAWSASCGTIDHNSGLFKAPASAGSCMVTATSTATGSRPERAQSTVVVGVVNYVTGRGDHSNIGVQTKETLLTPSNVNPTQFGQKWIVNVDAQVYAQPLYMNGLTINGAPHNVVFAATMNNTVYALDGATGATYWSRTYNAPAVTGTTIDTNFIPLIGILSTPVIDSAFGTLYFVTDTAQQCCDANGKLIVATHRLHAVSLTTGSEKFNGPVTISNPNLDPIHKLQRPGLRLANGMVYVAFGSVADKGTWNGLIFAFDKWTLRQRYVWNSVPSGSNGGIWMSGVPPAIDASGNLYLTTGNGTFDGVNNFGGSAVKLGPTLQVVDWFAPYNNSLFNGTGSADLDLGSGGVAIISRLNGQYPHELITCGKPPSIYVLNRDHMGNVGTNSDNIIQRLDHVLGTTDQTLLGHDQTCFAAPTYFNGNVYFVGLYDVLKMFSLNPNTGLLSTSPVSQGSFSYKRPGSQPVISANGNSNGIVWTTNQATGQLFANDASDVSKQLFSATISPSFLNRLTSPTVVNGYVYVGGINKVAAFTLK